MLAAVSAEDRGHLAQPQRLIVLDDQVRGTALDANGGLGHFLTLSPCFVTARVPRLPRQDLVASCPLESDGFK